MENRDRDKMSKNINPTPAGDLNRNTSSQEGQKKNDSNADFGQKIGRSENMENEPSRRPGNGKENMDVERGTGTSRGLDSGSEH